MKFLDRDRDSRRVRARQSDDDSNSLLGYEIAADDLPDDGSEDSSPADDAPNSDDASADTSDCGDAGDSGDCS